MRNCFVPWCDAVCKSQQKRMMFLPPKNKEIFEMWKQMLPKKREFKPTDKVCERHFCKEDIITTFDHTINGQLFQMERGRPKLKPNAVPCFNLPSEYDEQLYFRVRRGRMSKILKLEVQQLDNKKNELNEQQEEQIQSTETEVEGQDFEGEHPKKDSPPADEAKSCSADTEEEEHLQVDVQALFDFLYDDIFEVVLPNTLWGIHRDPQRGFIAFSYFDSETLKSTKSIILDSKGILKIYIFNKIVNEQSLTTEIAHELISHIISQVDEAKICKKAMENSFCDVKAADDSDHCTNCV